MAAAANIFAVAGYRGGSLRQIASDLGLSFTSVKHHFHTKENLLIAVLEANDALAVENLKADKAGLGFLESAIALAQRNLGKRGAQRLLALLAAEASAPDHPAHAWFLERYERVRGHLAQGIAEDIAAGRLSAEIDPSSTATTLMALWDGLQLQWLLYPDFDMISAMRKGFEALLRAS
ncbi:TetR/AcrR family transcriptional regulator [Paraburkholderia sp. WC7.3g]|uniref:TetR/AcrR family transcriptional regulator n=1 Tax=Paraburkholderia sp. WC7.3g TaxID=2991070 RepID=UPI003D21DC63